MSTQCLPMNNTVLIQVNRSFKRERCDNSILSTLEGLSQTTKLGLTWRSGLGLKATRKSDTRHKFGCYGRRRRGRALRQRKRRDGWRRKRKLIFSRRTTVFKCRIRRVSSMIQNLQTQTRSKIRKKDEDANWRSGCGLMPSSGLDVWQRRGGSDFLRRRRGWSPGSRRGGLLIRMRGVWPTSRHGMRRRRGLVGRRRQLRSQERRRRLVERRKRKPGARRRREHNKGGKRMLGHVLSLRQRKGLDGRRKNEGLRTKEHAWRRRSRHIWRRKGRKRSVNSKSKPEGKPRRTSVAKRREGHRKRPRAQGLMRTRGHDAPWKRGCAPRRLKGPAAWPRKGERRCSRRRHGSRRRSRKGLGVRLCPRPKVVVSRPR
mmetsp:Transcript_88956/g.237215  ORF Transcript_88956/g.237215 Transcript_88956/m.237215 type:complete len:372 (+) Transcript_88956:254-1369(+)